MGVISSLQAISGALYPTSSYWKVVLTSGKELTENQVVFDLRRGGYCPINWAYDLNATGDLLKIKELWLICPNGQRAMLKIDEPGTAFQFKYKCRDFLGAVGQAVEAHIIGKVTDKETGACTCWIWDRADGLIEYATNIKTFGMWRKNSGLMPLAEISREVNGLRLGW